MPAYFRHFCILRVPKAQGLQALPPHANCLVFTLMPGHSCIVDAPIFKESNLVHVCSLAGLLCRATGARVCGEEGGGGARAVKSPHIDLSAQSEPASCLKPHIGSCSPGSVGQWGRRGRGEEEGGEGSLKKK